MDKIKQLLTLTGIFLLLTSKGLGASLEALKLDVPIGTVIATCKVGNDFNFEVVDDLYALRCDVPKCAGPKVVEVTFDDGDAIHWNQQELIVDIYQEMTVLPDTREQWERNLPGGDRVKPVYKRGKSIVQSKLRGAQRHSDLRIETSENGNGYDIYIGGILKFRNKCAEGLKHIRETEEVVNICSGNTHWWP
jgi:hypothetical protein